MYEQGPFGKAVDLTTQVVNGQCPVCTQHGIFVSLHKTLFRCTTCGADIEQKINGKISYMPSVNHNTEIRIVDESKK
tara:strand:+ start:158 stop:388 length:231 start_codon:yes stop_codon:yes gene_type:complete